MLLVLVRSAQWFEALSLQCCWEVAFFKSLFMICKRWLNYWTMLNMLLLSRWLVDEGVWSCSMIIIYYLPGGRNKWCMAYMRAIETIPTCIYICCHRPCQLWSAINPFLYYFPCLLWCRLIKEGIHENEEKRSIMSNVTTKKSERILNVQLEIMIWLFWLLCFPLEEGILSAKLW